MLFDEKPIVGISASMVIFNVFQLSKPDVELDRKRKSNVSVWFFQRVKLPLYICGVEFCPTIYSVERREEVPLLEVVTVMFALGPVWI